MTPVGSQTEARLAIRVPFPMREELRVAADDLGLSMAALLRLILRTWLRQRREKMVV